MPLPWPEIRDKAITFSREWQDAESERAEAQTFWNEFFAVFGVPRRRVASFEEPIKKLGTKRGRIDAFWKGQLVVEHKSRGQDLDRAVDTAYGKKSFSSDAERVAFLFELYQKYTSLLPGDAKPKKGRRARAAR